MSGWWWLSVCLSGCHKHFFLETVIPIDTQFAGKIGSMKPTCAMNNIILRWVEGRSVLFNAKFKFIPQAPNFRFSTCLVICLQFKMVEMRVLSNWLHRFCFCIRSEQIYICNIHIMEMISITKKFVLGFYIAS